MTLVSVPLIQLAEERESTTPKMDNIKMHFLYSKLTAHFFLSHLNQTQQQLLDGLLPDGTTSPFLNMGNFYFSL